MTRILRAINTIIPLVAILFLITFFNPLMEHILTDEIPIVLFAVLLLVFCLLAIIALRTASNWFQAYQHHRTLLDIEMNLNELFRRINPNGVDKRRNRMVEVMTLAEECKQNRTARVLVNANHDRGASQETAREIIDRDAKDLGSFRTNRRSARVNAYAYEALLKGQFKAARNHILSKQLEAYRKERELPNIIPALLSLLKLPSRMTVSQIETELEKNNPLGVFPWSLYLAIRFWRHPSGMSFKQGESIYKGWEALEAMRNI